MIVVKLDNLHQMLAAARLRGTASSLVVKAQRKQLGLGAQKMRSGKANPGNRNSLHEKPRLWDDTPAFFA